MKKAYRKDPQVMWRVTSDSSPYSDEDVIRMMLPVRMAFELLRNGEATADDAYTLANAINDTAIRAWGLEDEDAANAAGPIANAAIHAMRRCGERYKRIGRLGLDGPGLADVAQGVDLYEQLVRLSTPAQMKAAASMAIKLEREQAA